MPFTLTNLYPNKDYSLHGVLMYTVNNLSCALSKSLMLMQRTCIDLLIQFVWHSFITIEMLTSMQSGAQILKC